MKATERPTYVVTYYDKSSCRDVVYVMTDLADAAWHGQHEGARLFLVGEEMTFEPAMKALQERRVRDMEASRAKAEAEDRTTYERLKLKYEPSDDGDAKPFHRPPEPRRGA